MTRARAKVPSVIRTMPPAGQSCLPMKLFGSTIGTTCYLLSPAVSQWTVQKRCQPRARQDWKLFRWFAHVHDSSGCHMSSEQPTLFSSTTGCKEDRIMELKVENSCLQRLIAELLLKNQRLREANLGSQSDCGKINQNRSRQRTESS